VRLRAIWVHPQSIRGTRDPCNLDLPREELDEEQNDKSLQPSPGPNFHGEKVRGHDQIPMLAQKLLPRCLPDPFRCRLDAVSFQDLRDRAAASSCPRLDNAPWIRRYPQSRFSSAMRTIKDSISPAVRGRPGARWSRSIVLLGDQVPMPCQQSLGCDNGGDLVQHLPAQHLGLSGYSPALMVIEAQSPIAELLAKDPVLLA
jgi:hypothetical protein